MEPEETKEEMNIETQEESGHIPYHMPEEAGDSKTDNKKAAVAVLVIAGVGILVVLAFLNRNILFPSPCTGSDCGNGLSNSEQPGPGGTHVPTLQEKVDMLSAKLPPSDGGLSEADQSQLEQRMAVSAKNTPESTKTMTAEEKLDILNKLGG